MLIAAKGTTGVTVLATGVTRWTRCLGFASASAHTPTVATIAAAISVWDRMPSMTVFYDCESI